MPRLDKATLFLPLCKSILSVSLSIKTYGLEVLAFSEFINIVSILHLFWFNHVIVYFLVISFDWYREYTIFPILFSNFSGLLCACTCARTIGNLWSICLGVDILNCLSKVLVTAFPCFLF